MIFLPTNFIWMLELPDSIWLRFNGFATKICRSLAISAFRSPALELSMIHALKDMPP